MNLGLIRIEESSAIIQWYICKICAARAETQGRWASCWAARLCLMCTTSSAISHVTTSHGRARTLLHQRWGKSRRCCHMADVKIHWMSCGECTNHDERTTHSTPSASHKEVATELREQRRAHYKKRPLVAKMTTGAKEKKKVNVEVGSPMDDFINPANHDDPIDCHRIVPMLFCENDKRRT